MTALPPLREVIARHDLWSRKALGQHFLLDMNLTRRIAREAGIAPDMMVYEVGPGPGGLTRALLETGAAVMAVEKDRRAVAALSELQSVYPETLTIVEDDALAVDERALLGAAPRVRVVANLPYNIATPLLVKWLSTDPWPPWYESLTLMFQKEVAARITAAPGGKSYGRLAVLTALRAEARTLFDVPPRAFVPPPKVTSSVVQIVPRPAAVDVPVAAVSRITEAAFGRRRKMLRQSLKSVFQDPEAVLGGLGIAPTARAEELRPDDFLTLARHLPVA